MTDLSKINARAIELGRQALLPGILPGKVPEKMLFVTISGAHLYGFPSPDSDIDLRGTHLLPLKQLVGLATPEETYETHGGRVEGIEVDCVTHDLGKYLRLLVKKNGYVLEQILSPLVVHDSGCLEELRALARGAMTRHLSHHYKGFFRTQEKLVLKMEPPTAKSVLYLFRVAMTALHVLKTGEVEANISRLNEHVFKFPFIPDLIARKVGGTEFGKLLPREVDGLMGEAKRLEAEIDVAFENSVLPDEVKNYDAVNDFLTRLRLY